MNLSIIQERAVKKLSKLKAGALFMKMGTGKTKTALDLSYSRKDDFDFVIWIAPASLIYSENYLNEIHRWNKGLDIKFFTIEGVSASDKKFLEMRSLAANNDTFCVVDESLTIKNSDARRTKRLLDMWYLFKFRLILNGTPLTQGLIDLYSQIQFIHPSILSMTEAQFANNFLQYKKDGYKPWRRWSKPENETALVELIRPYIFDVDLDIPVKIFNQGCLVNLTKREWREYNDCKQAFLHGKFEVEFLTVAQKFQFYYTLCKEKIVYFKKLIHQLNNGIIFVKFIKELDLIKDILPGVIEYSGRQKDNLDKGNFIVTTYGSGSKGLNLQRFNNIIFFSQTFDYAHKEHGLHRVYRNGQCKDVTIYNIWVNTGLENLIKSSLNKKTNVLSNVSRIISQKEAKAL